jgi:signal transduction histidine kinase/ActR/RegA family two-component response regulator
MTLKLRSSIVLMVVVGLLIPATVTSLLTLQRRQDTLTAEMQADHERLTRIVALGMQEPLWNLNPEAGVPLLESLFGDARVVGVVVDDMRHRPFLARSAPERRTGHPATLERDVVYRGQAIGRVRLEMDSGPLERALAGERRVLAGTVAGQLLLSLVLIVTLLQRRMLVPIRRLMDESRRLAARDLATPFVWKPVDELGSLGASLEHTRQALRALFEEIEDKNRLLEEDLRQRALTERELQRHRDHLEELIRERTGELQAAMERADIANRAKTRFLSNMTHELRTPLNAILGYAQLLLSEPPLAPRQAQALGTIRKSGEHLLALITDLLDLAKIESGKFDLVPEATDLHGLLADVADIVRVRAEEKRLRFEFAPDLALPARATLDDRRLRQVLLNLLGNAVKFTDAGHVRLAATGTALPDGMLRLRFEIEDTGVGVDAAQVARIFQPFEQAGDPRRRAGGTGLGLSISRQLVRAMGGEIEVASEPGRGSRFSFEIVVPRAETAPAPAPDASPPAAQDGPDPAWPGRRRRVLIVDDVEANRDLLRHLLEPLGFEVDVASNGREGLDRALAGRPDLVLMDVVMPVMDGLAAARRLRALPASTRPRIIAISASVSGRAEADALLAGADAFVSKPIDRLALLRRIGELLGLEPADDDHAPGRPRAGELVPPPDHEMALLAEAAEEGDMRAVRRRADAIERLGERYAPFARHLRELADAYQSIEILKLVRRHAPRHTTCPRSRP